MYSMIMSFYVVVCFGLVITVLLQSSKGEGLAGAFGGSGGGSGAVFGRKDRLPPPSAEIPRAN